MKFGKQIAALGALVAIVFSAQARAASVNVAVIDSGVDYKHILLKDKMWNNAGEILNDGQDNDNNGKIDDSFGWNFAEGNGQIIDYSYLGTFSNDPYKFFEIQLKSFQGTITQEEKDWVNSKKADPNFIAEINKFGNFVHGTHVAGISSRVGDQKIIGMKLIPTEVKKPFAETMMALADAATSGNGQVGDIVKDLLVKQLLTTVAQQNGKQLEPIGLYAYSTKARVANCSFGSSVPALKESLAPLISQIMGREISDEEATAYAKFTVDQMLISGRQFTVDANETFFVIAAGNDGGDNDDLPTFPANVKRRNTIAVAATQGLSKIAKFSNYGLLTVEVAAPGVGIESSIPGNEMLKVSGTSQAAPFVTNVVARMIEENPAMTFGDIRSVLMGTVDRKDFLTDKVISGGIANPERAAYAARLMKSRSVGDAINAARLQIADMTEKKSSAKVEGIFLPLPSLIQ